MKSANSALAADCETQILRLRSGLRGWGTHDFVQTCTEDVLSLKENQNDSKQ